MLIVNTSPDINNNTGDNKASLLKRLYIYQKERFPIIGHGILVSSFSFSAISYSRICRGAEGFVSWSVFSIGIITTVTLFLLVRIFDEFKDADDDAKFRKSLPVPRGLIQLRELMVLGVVIAALQILLNFIFFPKMLLLYLIVIAYLSLMGKEFFASEWLKKHQFWYVTSHMFIIPLIDIYASGLDWFLAGVPAPKGLIFFFAVSYMNGIVIEVGRKIRIPQKEAEGVLTYTSMLGTNRATVLWILVLFITLCLSIVAADFAQYGSMGLKILVCAFTLCSLPAILFLFNKTETLSKLIEKSAALWTICMYLTLGAVPMIQKLISGI